MSILPPDLGPWMVWQLPQCDMFKEPECSHTNKTAIFIVGHKAEALYSIFFIRDGPSRFAFLCAMRRIACAARAHWSVLEREAQCSCVACARCAPAQPSPSQAAAALSSKRHGFCCLPRGDKCWMIGDTWCFRENVCYSNDNTCDEGLAKWFGHCSVQNGLECCRERHRIEWGVKFDWAVDLCRSIHSDESSFQILR